MRNLFIILLLFFTSLSFADEIMIPFDCYPKEIKAKLEETGRILDLDGNDRTEYSWGFIENKGTTFILYTYKPVTQEDLNVIMRIMQGERWRKPQ